MLKTLKKIVRNSVFFVKKIAVEQVFGPNFCLASHATRGEPQNQWAALGTAYETLDKKDESLILERVRGIEPLSSAWKAEVMPLYDTRIFQNFVFFAILLFYHLFGMPRFELGPSAPKALMLPLHHIPLILTRDKKDYNLLKVIFLFLIIVLYFII